MTRNSLSNTIRLTVGALALGCCVSTFAAQNGAAPAGNPQAQQGFFWIGDLDTNHDGRISPQEAAAMPNIAKNFALLDLNHDGYLTMSEVQAMWAQEIAAAAKSTEAGRAAAFDKCDKKKAGKLKADELKACMPRVAANFGAIDKDKDGYVSKADVVGASQMAAQAAMNQMRQRNAQAFAKADTNKDGKLSQAEFAAAFPRLAKSFAFFDENHDGFVEPNEFALPPR